jgi:hypothetical protein
MRHRLDAPFRETKPIPRRVGPAGSGLCGTDPISSSPAGVRGWILPNKPNSARPVRPWQTDCAKQSQFDQLGRDPQTQLRQTKPNLGRMGYLGDGGLPPKRGNVPNEPNFREPAEAGVGCTNKANSSIADLGLRIADGRRPCGRRARCAKQTQFPAPTEEFGRGRPTHEEPNCAKRTQFPAARMAAGAGFCQTKPIWPAQSDSGCRLCRTNPIPRRGRPGGWSIVQNEPNQAGDAGIGGTEYAKQTQFGQAGRRAGSPKGENVRNKPNLGRWEQAPAGWNVRNEPNSRRGRVGRGTRGLSRQTNPISQICV